MNKRVNVALVYFIIIFIVIAAFYTYRRLNLMIKEDIILDIEENYESAWLKYGESYDFKTEVEINNYWLCTAVCEQEIIDIHSGDKLLNETFYVTNNKKKTTTIRIYPHKGYGQSIYQYEIKCQNIPSNRCPASNSTYVRKNTLIINHEPNDQQKILIEESIYLFNNISHNIAHAELNIDNATNILYNVDVNFQEYTKKDALRYSSVLKYLNDAKEDIIVEWKKDEYEKSYEKIKEIYDPSNELFANTSALLDDIRITVDKHNTIVNMHRGNLYKAMIIKEMLKYYPGKIDEFRDDAMTSLQLVNINTVKMNKLGDYDALLREAQLEEKSIDYTMRLFNQKAEQTKSDYVDIYLADALSCVVLGCNQTPINHSVDGIDDVKNRCVLYDDIIPRFIEAQNITSGNRNKYNESLQHIDIREKRHMIAMLDYFKTNDSIINERIIRYISSINESINAVNDSDIVFLSDTSILNDTSIYGQYYSLGFQPMIDVLNNISSYCGRPPQNFSFDDYNIYEQIIPEFDQPFDIEKISLPMQKCCFFGVCRQCGSDKKNPIVLLHGHSFNQKNSAYQSTDIFNQLETRLVSEGYVSLGIWKPYSEKKNAIRENVIFKPTYYITTYSDALGTSTIQSKDESIEEYAKRLKDAIDNIKLITGSDKVDIVAHSMGGLVTRKYIQEYGPYDIDKLILIGTPNNGITDRIYSVCKIFGNEKECDEMHQGSEFMKSLNQSIPMPKKYLIIGKGCDMQGKDGDGIVTVENSKLGNYKTYYIEGNCTGTSFLHNSMLNREDVAEIIINIID